MRLGVPAHITILVPFMSPERITPSVRARIQAALNDVSCFAFSLNRVGRFPATAYLAPDPAEPFIALTQALVRQFPEYPPFRGEHASIIPHLTVARGDPDEAEAAAAELAASLRLVGPINGYCASVTLLENSSGLWKSMQAFSLPR